MTDTISAAFATRALIPACEAARALGVDEKTLRRLAEAGAIRSVLVGQRTRRFTEADLRAFLRGETCLSTSPHAARSGTTTSSSKAKGFTARLAPGRGERLKLVSDD